MATLGLQTVIHGKLYTYQELKCRCEDCRQANRERRRAQRVRGAAFLDVTREQRRHCQICHTPISVHPIKACWREA